MAEGSETVKKTGDVARGKTPCSSCGEKSETVSAGAAKCRKCGPRLGSSLQDEVLKLSDSEAFATPQK